MCLNQLLQNAVFKNRKTKTSVNCVFIEQIGFVGYLVSAYNYMTNLKNVKFYTLKDKLYKIN